MRLTKSTLKRLIQEELQLILNEKKPYKGARRGKTESQVQQNAAAIALKAKRAGKCNELPEGSAKKMCKSMTEEEIDKLATIRRGAEIPDSTKKGNKLAALPKRIEET